MSLLQVDGDSAYQFTRDRRYAFFNLCFRYIIGQRRTPCLSMLITLATIISLIFSMLYALTPLQNATWLVAEH